MSKETKYMEALPAEIDKDLSGQLYEGASFKNENFLSCNFNKTSFLNCDFSHANVSMSSFENSVFHNVDLHAMKATLTKRLMSAQFVEIGRAHV